MSLRSLMAVIGVMAAVLPGGGMAATGEADCPDVASGCQIAAAAAPAVSSEREAVKSAHPAAAGTAASERRPPALTNAAFERRAKYRELGWRMIENLGGPGGIFTLR